MPLGNDIGHRPLCRSSTGTPPLQQTKTYTLAYNVIYIYVSKLRLFLINQEIILFIYLQNFEQPIKKCNLFSKLQ